MENEFVEHVNKLLNEAEPHTTTTVLQVEGTEKIYARYQTIVSTTKSKTYDVLDLRRLEVTSYKLYKSVYINRF